MTAFKGKLLLFNHVFLLLCASMYLGTGGSLIFFSFPIAPQLTPDNYYLQFVPQVEAATTFFTPMTELMAVSGFIMLWAEWKQSTRWIPIIYLLALAAATVLTRQNILPLNTIMASHIHDPIQLHQILNQWMSFNRLRVACWVIEWISIVWYFYIWSLKSRYPQWTR